MLTKRKSSTEEDIGEGWFIILFRPETHILTHSSGEGKSPSPTKLASSDHQKDIWPAFCCDLSESDCQLGRKYPNHRQAVGRRI